MLKFTGGQSIDEMAAVRLVSAQRLYIGAHECRACVIARDLLDSARGHDKFSEDWRRSADHTERTARGPVKRDRAQQEGEIAEGEHWIAEAYRLAATWVTGHTCEAPPLPDDEERQS